MSTVTASGSGSPVSIALPAGTWTFTVQAVNAAGQSPQSGGFTATVTPAPAGGSSFPTTFPATF